jgi:enoyl-CoA hydratase/carnithine racemase
MPTLTLERRGALATLTLSKPRGNAIDEALVAELSGACGELAADPELRGVLLASAHPRLFCPGLDLIALSEYDRPALQRFMERFAEMVFALFALEPPVVAAVSGHAVAGGCILALTADLRLLKRGAQIGLNEVKVGIPLPWSVAALLRFALDPRALTEVALLGRNFKDEAALAVGLGDAVLEAVGFEDACRHRLEEFLDKDPRALRTTKRYLRTQALAEMRSRERESLGEWLDTWFEPSTRERVRSIVRGLGGAGAG